jgi:hypothetical protein
MNKARTEVARHKESQATFEADVQDWTRRALEISPRVQVTMPLHKIQPAREANARALKANKSVSFPRGNAPEASF